MTIDWSLGEEVRTSVNCRGQDHALWWTNIAYGPSDRMDSTKFDTLSPGSAYPQFPTGKPTACPLDGSGLYKSGDATAPSSQAAVRWL